ncbi:GNAT family N-acetyltransferase [Bacillus sp. T33-2]|uniref:GNAT family N-acetyltransferase n=1 Tax=Bacillus sp. T33-2 TaxID=2054168 RepID=UPI0015E0D877|nr:GNAT family N-acetyltransferase [Bacillus sp. T33-2]
MVYIKEISMDDCSQLLEFELANKGFFENYIPARDSSYYSVEGIARSIELMYSLRNQDEYYLYLVRNESDDLVGRINIFNINRDHLSAEIGYRIGESHTGKGYAERSVELIEHHAATQLGIKILTAQTIASNMASARVLVKRHFTLTETVKNLLPFNGQLHDAHIFQKEI